MAFVIWFPLNFSNITCLSMVLTPPFACGFLGSVDSGCDGLCGSVADLFQELKVLLPVEVIEHGGFF